MTTKPEYDSLEEYSKAHNLNLQELSRVVNKSFSTYYSTIISNKVKLAMYSRIQNGQWPGRAPIGYTNVNKDIAQHPTMSLAVRIIFESTLEGLSYEATIDRLYDE